MTLLSEPFVLKITRFIETECQDCGQFKESIEGINIDFQVKILCLDCIEKKYGISLHDKERKPYVIKEEKK